MRVFILFILVLGVFNEIHVVIPLALIGCEMTLANSAPGTSYRCAVIGQLSGSYSAAR